MPNLFIHIAADIVFAAVIILLFKRLRAKDSFLKISGLLIASNLIDLDHFLADPIYDAARCSINFHPLHSWPAFPVYAAALLFPKARIFGLGVILHLILDAINCLLIGAF